MLLVGRGRGYFFDLHLLKNKETFNQKESQICKNIQHIVHLSNYQYFVPILRKMACVSGYETLTSNPGKLSSISSLVNN